MAKKYFHIYIIEGKDEHIFIDIKKKDLKKYFIGLLNDKGKIFYKNKVIRPSAVKFFKIVKTYSPIEVEIKRKRGSDVLSKIKKGLNMLDPLSSLIDKGIEMIDTGYKEYILEGEDITSTLISSANTNFSNCSIIFTDHDLEYIRKQLSNGGVKEVLKYSIAKANAQGRKKDKNELYIFMNRLITLEKENLLGIITKEEMNVKINKLIMDILNYIQC